MYLKRCTYTCLIARAITTLHLCNMIYKDMTNEKYMYANIQTYFFVYKTYSFIHAWTLTCFFSCMHAHTRRCIYKYSYHYKYRDKFMQKHMHAYTHVYTAIRSLSCALSLTHSHSLSLSRARALSLSLSLSLTHTHTLHQSWKTLRVVLVEFHKECQKSFGWQPIRIRHLPRSLLSQSQLILISMDELNLICHLTRWRGSQN